MASVSFLENKNLKKLLEIFRKNNKNLYVVGGAVRDFLLGLTPKKMDIDLCSAVSIQELVFMLEGSDFFVRPKSLMMGVVSIVCNEESFEYAQFRKESYSNSHSHNPKQIEFVTSLEIDAMRRDFTINSIYFDLINSEFIDLFGGIEDLQNRLIRTVQDPKITLAVDPARILRMIEFSLRLGFEIDGKTREVARVFAKNCLSMAPSRKEIELNKIKNADKCYLNFTPRDFERTKDSLLREFGIF